MPLLFPDILNCFINLNIKNLNELRLRHDKNVTANISGIWQLAEYKGEPIKISSEQIEKILLSACENSLYAYNDSLKKGYITTRDGIRVGICGKCVFNGDNILTITEFSSLCIRFPHQVIGCSNKIYDIIFNNGRVGNTLLISPPGEGKTTALRDLARLISIRLNLNVLIIDEREEIFNSSYQLGDTCDVMISCNKSFGFVSGIKNMCPNVIIVDELAGEDDVEGIEFALRSGVSVIGTVHGSNYNDILNKVQFKSLITNKCFDYFITLSRRSENFNISEVVMVDR